MRLLLALLVVLPVSCTRGPAGGVQCDDLRGAGRLADLAQALPAELSS